MMAVEDTEVECRECGISMLIAFGDQVTDICQRCEVDGLRASLAKAEGDAEAHRMRCDSLALQLEAWKRRGLESDERAIKAETELRRRTKVHAEAMANQRYSFGLTISHLTTSLEAAKAQKP